MSKQRYTPEFKDEAVHRIIDRGYSVSEVSERPGVSSHSQYKWVQAVRPDKTEEKCSGACRGHERDSSFTCAAASYRRRAKYLMKGRKVLCQSARVKYRFIDDHCHEFAVATMCRVLRVVRASYAASRGVYGAMRVFQDPREAGESCGKHRVARIMS